MTECIWSKKDTCPFEEQPENPVWCEVCVALASARGQADLVMTMKMQIVMGLIQMYRDEDKAKEVYEKLIELALKWGMPKIEVDKQSEDKTVSS